MEGRSLVLGYCNSSSKFLFNLYDNVCLFSPRHPHRQTFPYCLSFSCSSSPRSSKEQKPWVKLRNKSELATNQGLALSATLKETDTKPSSSVACKEEDTYALPRIDKSGRFCSPRAARELALSIVYASCLEGSDPIRFFDNRLNAPRELDYKFDQSSLLQYDHKSVGGPPVSVDTMEEAEQLLSQLEADSAIEVAVLSAPPKLVYSKLILRLTRKLLAAVADRWDSNVLVIDKVTPSDWKIEPSGRLLEFSILHLAMAEMSELGTNHRIVINEAVDLAKRFCDGAAPRVINGCLRTFVQDLY